MSKSASDRCVAHVASDGVVGMLQTNWDQELRPAPPKPEAFDQQPVEASATISACLAAWLAEEGAEWPAEAMRAFGWFMGENDLQTTLIDPDTGSCSDGLHPDRPNENKGAELVLSYLLGLVEIRRLKRMTAIGRMRPTAKLKPAALVARPISKSPREPLCRNPDS